MTFPSAHAERLLDELIYDRVSAAVDVERLRDLEGMLEYLLGEIDELSDDDVRSMTNEAIERAFRRIANELRDTADCPLCRDMAAIHERSV